MRGPYLILLVAIFCTGCDSFFRNRLMTDTESQLATDLMDLGYMELFLSFDEEAIDSIWNRPDASAALAELVLDDGAADLARFLAAELLFYKVDDYPPDSARPVLVEIYTTALAHDFVGVANPWGLPGSLDVVGQHLVELGDAAVPRLVSLLDDNMILLYEGSKEATFGNSYQYRVKDIAAFLISQIAGLEYEVHLTPAERDTEIEQLKSNLP